MRKCSDFIFVITWPYGLVKGANSWYDYFLSNHKSYNFGHTALILVNSKNGSSYYFDFGRFQGQEKSGIIRDSSLEKKLRIHKKAEVYEGEIQNAEQILCEINNNSSTKDLFPNNSMQIMYAATIKNIDFEKSYQFIKDMMDKSYKYGPFVKNGLTCGRFVYKVVNKSNASVTDKFRTTLFDMLIRIKFFEKICVKFYYKKVS